MVRRMTSFAAAALIGWTAAIPAANAQEILDAWVEFNWVDMSQQTCLDNAEMAIDRAIEAFGIEGANTRVEGWNVLGITDDLNMWVFCVADADGLVDANADRLLIMTSVNTARTDVNGSDLRDFLSDCVWDTCPAGGGKGDGPVAGMTWFDGALEYRDQNGTLLDFDCPPLGDSEYGPIWGTEVYTDDSSICAAAVHTGVIGFDGGSVTIEILPGRKAYAGSEQNGITSQEWDAYDGSFRVVIPAG